MATKMKVKKGDMVQMLTGKDRGKRGRVIEARPSERRVIVENLNVAKRHTKPRPIRDSSRMGGAQVVPGGILDKPAPDAGVERHGRLPRLRQPDARRHAEKEVKGEIDPRPRLQARGLRPGDRSLMAEAPTMETYVPRLKQRYEERDPPAAPGGARRLDGHGRPEGHEDDAEHGRGRGEDRCEGARRRDRRADHHRRSARPGAPRDEVDRELQAPRGDARRRARHAARRADVRVPRPTRVDRASAHPRLPRPRPRVVRRSRQLLDRDPGADHLPGDRLRQGSGDPRPRRRDHDVGEVGRGGPRAARRARTSVRHERREQ